jgi:DNA-binding helix-hairpin-helix protein with protein kinase domain
MPSTKSFIKRKNAFMGLAQKRHEEFEHLRSYKRQKQVESHSRQFFISDGKIPRVGPTRTATLESYGIETAYDINPYVINGIPRFGEVIQRHLLDWRSEMDRDFRINPKRGMSPHCCAPI